MATLMPRLLYPRGKRTRNPSDRKLDGPQNRSKRRGEEKIFRLAGIELRPLSRAVRSQSLSRLCTSEYHKSALELEMPETSICCSISGRSQESFRLAMLSPSTCFRFGSSSRRGLYDVIWHHLTDGNKLLHFN
jgi:hypothetical protein